MIGTYRWIVIALMTILSASLTSQRPTQAITPKLAPPPANSSNGNADAELKLGFHINRWFQLPSFLSSTVPQPLKQSDQTTTAAPGKVITSLAFPMVMQPQPLFQTPEPFSPLGGFQGHAAYFRKVQQEEWLKQQALAQSLYAHRLQAFQQQQAEQQQMIQMIQGKQFLQQMHPAMRQWFQQMNPLAQFNIFQQYLKNQRFLQEQAVKNPINKQQKLIFLPQARDGQRNQEQSANTESS